MPITNGTFGTDISGWTPSGTGNYDVIWDAGRARLRIYRCSNAYMEQTFVIDRNTLTFDWQTHSDNWYEDASWKLVIGGTAVISEGLSTAKSGGYSGTRTVDVSAYIGQTATIKFQVTPGIYCGSGDHANTYLWVDNVTNTTTGILITATDISISPGPYIEPSTIIVTATWQNQGSLQGSFDPAIIITSSDGTMAHMNIGSMTTLDPTQSTTQILFTVPDLIKDTYRICPDPN